MLEEKVVLITFEAVKKLNRQNSEVYLGMYPLSNIRSWRLPVISSEKVVDDTIIVIFEVLINSSTNLIQILNPKLIYKLPSGADSDEYPVIFYEKNDYFPNYCLNQLMTCDFFNRLIEKNEKISSNSTKVITLRSLWEMFKEFSKYRIDQQLWSQLSRNLIEYTNLLINCNYELGYLPVVERKKFRKASIADSTIAWSCYFRLFIEEWNTTHSTVVAPDLSKTFHYKGWSGKFFDRENPLFHVNNGNFHFNYALRDSIYQIWKEWIKEA